MTDDHIRWRVQYACTEVLLGLWSGFNSGCSQLLSMRRAGYRWVWSTGSARPPPLNVITRTRDAWERKGSSIADVASEVENSDIVPLAETYLQFKIAGLVIGGILFVIVLLVMMSQMSSLQNQTQCPGGINCGAPVIHLSVQGWLPVL